MDASLSSVRVLWLVKGLLDGATTGTIIVYDWLACVIFPNEYSIHVNKMLHSQKVRTDKVWVCLDPFYHSVLIKLSKANECTKVQNPRRHQVS